MYVVDICKHHIFGGKEVTNDRVILIQSRTHFSVHSVLSVQYRTCSDHEKIINENNDKQRKDLSTLLHYFGIRFMTPRRPITY